MIAVDAVWRKEAVVDALAEAVRVDRIAEIAVGVAVVLAERRGRHAELEGGLEIFQDVAPVALVAGAAAVALVHDDEVEEVRREFAVEAGPPLVAGDGLIDGEVHLAAFVWPRLSILQRASPKGAKILSFGSSTRMLRSAR